MHELDQVRGSLSSVKKVTANRIPRTGDPKRLTLNSLPHCDPHCITAPTAAAVILGELGTIGCLWKKITCDLQDDANDRTVVHQKV